MTLHVEEVSSDYGSVVTIVALVVAVIAMLASAILYKKYRQAVPRQTSAQTLFAKNPLHIARLPWLILIVGAIVIGIHDLAYRRADDGSGDYELGGIMTHAAVDMVILTVILAAVVALYGDGNGRRKM